MKILDSLEKKLFVSVILTRQKRKSQKKRTKPQILNYLSGRFSMNQQCRISESLTNLISRENHFDIKTAFSKIAPPKESSSRLFKFKLQNKKRVFCLVQKAKLILSFKYDRILILKILI
jgi:hypothetical protein